MFIFTALYYAVINIIAFILYGIDKHKAKKEKWRISEAVLITVAVIGGALGAFAGMKLFHHKTRKKKFRIAVPLFIVLHALILCYIAAVTLIPGFTGFIHS